ncbi:glucosamine-6-phosphate deaminase [Allorhizobium undicola]|uniref:glucosamine-6-phosphate deaminase n=1 Tax=Allorhizobium undicola TaxID=78527 RepID=UPI000A059409|nr:glucosamine-6-phosphate deaminase [Allorhizobium undicola]
MPVSSTTPVIHTPARHVMDNSHAAAERVARSIIETVRQKPRTVLGLATGATMEPVYRHLVAAHAGGAVSFAGVTSFNLDEYANLAPTHPGSYRSTMNRLFFDHVDIDPGKTFLPDGQSRDRRAAAQAYEAAIVAAGGIDLQLLGLGGNGHIGFNEPGSAFSSRTRQVALHISTIEANRGFFADGAVPAEAITMGIGTILEARRILVLATGSRKAAAVRSALCGTITENCPASALLAHPSVTWIVDRDAASLMT